MTRCAQPGCQHPATGSGYCRDCDAVLDWLADNRTTSRETIPVDPRRQVGGPADINGTRTAA